MFEEKNMRQITEAQYQLALSRVEELLPAVGEDMSPDDPKAVELAMMSDYEESHYPIEKPTVAELIKDGLKEMKLTQKELAQQLGISTTRVNDFTSGRAEPSLSVAGSICRILRISPSAMMRM